MATATVYTISYATGEVIEEFDCDYNFAIGQYHNKRTSKGTYYIARKGVKIPYRKKARLLKNVKHQSQDHEPEH